jgi:hypothetical protein
MHSYFFMISLLAFSLTSFTYAETAAEKYFPDRFKETLEENSVEPKDAYGWSVKGATQSTPQYAEDSEEPLKELPLGFSLDRNESGSRMLNQTEK